MIDPWSDQTEHPDVLNPSGNGFSIDVLVFCPRTGEHTIGWFDFNNHCWSFLANEPVRDFFWRFLDQICDRPQPPSEKKLKS